MDNTQGERRDPTTLEAGHDDAVSALEAAQRELEQALATTDHGRPVDLARYADAMAQLNDAVVRWNDYFR